MTFKIMLYLNSNRLEEQLPRLLFLPRHLMVLLDQVLLLSQDSLGLLLPPLFLLLDKDLESLSVSLRNRLETSRGLQEVSCQMSWLLDQQGVSQIEQLAVIEQDREELLLELLAIEENLLLINDRDNQEMGLEEEEETDLRDPSTTDEETITIDLLEGKDGEDSGNRTNRGIKDRDKDSRIEGHEILSNNSSEEGIKGQTGLVLVLIDRIKTRLEGRIDLHLELDPRCLMFENWRSMTSRKQMQSLLN